MDKHILTDEELLFAVEELFDRAKKEFSNEQQREVAFVAKCSELVFIMGMYMASDEFKKNGIKPTQDEAKRKAVECAQSRWETICIYMKDTHNYKLNPMGLLLMLNLFLDPDDQIIQDTIVDIVSNKINDELKSISVREVVPVPEIENFQGDPKELVRAYFTIFSELGTFYGDRSVYETDDQKHKHDQLVAIFNKLKSSKLIEFK